MSERITATIESEDFIGRRGELDALRRHANGENRSNALLLIAAPASGASEILKQTYDALFRERGATIPIYFAVGEADQSAKDCAKRFLNVFLAQTAAFRRNDAKLTNGSPNLSELAEIAAPEDADWINRVIANCRLDDELHDDRAYIRGCLSAPLRAVAASGAKFFVMLDDLHETAYLTDEIEFFEELKEVFSRSESPFVFSGRRRFLYGAARTRNALLNGAAILRLEPLNFTDAGLLAENLARRFDVVINEQTRDLMARKFDGNPAFIKKLLQAASAGKTDLDSFAQIEKLYADELFGGAFGAFYDDVFQRVAPHVETRKSLVGLIYDALTVEREKVSVAAWQSRLGLDDADFHRLMSRLNSAEIVRVTTNLVEAMPENEVLSDYLTARYRLETVLENRALVVGETVSAFLKRAPRTMAKFYRQSAAIGLRELLATFNNQETPLALLDYAIYKEHYKGAEDAEVLHDAKTIRLPQIVYAAHTVAVYPPLATLTEKTRSAVALGFVESAYTDADETVWLAAEIDSKLEASKDLTEFWCDRLEMVALVCNFANYKLWLVAPEGFTPEASEVLQTRNAFGSSVKQIGLLKKHLRAETLIGEKKAAREYEIVVPMGDETELIAAHTVEEIAKRHQFSPKAVNQIKTALVEACINATEHSLSPDGKIYQKFVFETDKLIITVANRGLRIADKQATEITPDEGRRGWGLKLIKTLMDEVKFEQVDDGTRISMTKYLKK